MFSPTEFPCTAWRVTDAFNVLACQVTARNGYYVASFDTDGGMRWASELYVSKAHAVDGAASRLEFRKARLKKAVANLKLRERMVARLKAEIAAESAQP